MKRTPDDPSRFIEDGEDQAFEFDGPDKGTPPIFEKTDDPTVFDEDKDEVDDEA